MGLIFKKYAVYRSCLSCKIKYNDELRIGENFILFKPVWKILGDNNTKKRLVPKTKFLGKCEKCNHNLHPLNEIIIYYILRGAKYKIPSNSIIALLFVKLPSIVFGFLGVLPFIIFMTMGISRSYEGFESAFLEVYERCVLEIFGSNFFVIFFIFLTIYFVSHIVIFLYHYIKYIYR